MRHARKVAAGALLALAIVVVPVLCLRLPFARRLVAANVNRALSSAFVGHVVVDRIGDMSLTSAGGIDAHVEADDGGGLVKVDGVRARVSTWKLLRSVLGYGDIAVDLPEVSVAGAEVTIDPDENGTLRIARAFVWSASSWSMRRSTFTRRRRPISTQTSAAWRQASPSKRASSRSTSPAV